MKMNYRELIIKILEHPENLDKEVTLRTYEGEFIKIKDLIFDPIAFKMLLTESYGRV